MRKLFKISGIILGVILLLVTIGYAFLMTKYPKNIAVRDIKINATVEMFERGKYLANNFAGCMDCHSQRDYNKLTGPLVSGTEGMGGMDFGEGAGFVPAKNITSDIETGIGSWTDGEVFRAITCGLDKDGKELGPMMPYTFFRNMDEEDVIAIIAYIRTLPPKKNAVEQHKFNFPLNLIFRTIPGEPDFKKRPDPNDKVALGAYYGISCKVCHSPMDGPDFIPGKEFAGGVEIPNPKGGVIRSGNITPDKETGIGNWTRQQFIDRFRLSAMPETQNITIMDGEFNTIMPWTFFATATDEDLGAVYDYLMSQKPVYNKVEKFTPPVKEFGK